MPVAGNSSTSLCAVRPPESVTSTDSSRCDGYSWSGASNVPLLTPLNVSMMCEWQSDGQCRMVSVQSYADAGSAPSWMSVAVALNEITSPTLHGGSDACGLSMVTRRRTVGDRDGPARRPGGARRIGHLQADLDVADARVGLRGGHPGRVVVLAVAVEVPGVRERVAVRVGGAAGVEVDAQRRRPERRRRREARDRRDVGAVVVDAPDLAAVVVGVGQVAGRADGQEDRPAVGLAGRALEVREQAPGADVGQAVRPGRQLPDAAAGVVGHEQRAMIGGGIRAGRGQEGKTRDGGAADAAAVTGDDRGLVVVGVVREGDLARRAGCCRSTARDRRTPAGPPRPRSTASRSCGGPRRHRPAG